MSCPDPDLELMRRCAREDEDALRALVARHQTLLFGLSRRILGNAEDAEEVATATFLKAWNGARSFRGECSVKAYLCRIAINLCRDRPLPKPLLPLPEENRDGRIDAIHEAIDRLPAEDRELIVLYYLDELDYEEMCDSLEISYDVLKTRLVRARKRLRALLEVEYV